MATTGFNDAALRAGQYPDTMPTNTLINTPKKKFWNDINTGKPIGPLNTKVSK